MTERSTAQPTGEFSLSHATLARMCAFDLHESIHKTQQKVYSQIQLNSGNTLAMSCHSNPPPTPFSFAPRQTFYVLVYLNSNNWCTIVCDPRGVLYKLETTRGYVNKVALHVHCMALKANINFRRNHNTISVAILNSGSAPSRPVDLV